ncbi:MAG: PhzF family phenazine biosynthesis protein [Clostridia bacterium]|nr:PhzF family phenazine biosynthesis protein [Clostridia bacterium]
MKQYIIDAFTDKPFHGNPAAVCVTDRWLPDETMQAIAAENNLAETAFVVKEGDRYRIRWFTPMTEEELCGHATLAASFVILSYYEPDADEVRYTSISGELSVKRRGDLFELNFPTYELLEIPVTDEMERAYGARPEKAILGLDLNCVFENEAVVRGLNPDYTLLKTLPGRIWNATARGKEYDCISRSFTPEITVPEDPVCGSAHCQIADYWAGVLGKRIIRAYQASARGGALECEPLGNGRIALRGKAVLFAVSEIAAPLSERTE